MTFSNFQDLFSSAAKRLNLDTQLHASLICSYAKNYLKANLKNSSIAQVAHFRHGKITLHVPHSTSAQILNSHRLKLIDYINEKTSAKTVDQIIIRVIEQDNATIA